LKKNKDNGDSQTINNPNANESNNRDKDASNSIINVSSNVKTRSVANSNDGIDHLSISIIDEFLKSKDLRHILTNPKTKMPFVTQNDNN